ncbi:hypothetical protein GGI35DRAFT_47714 [Trichoderma velutinum]
MYKSSQIHTNDPLELSLWPHLQDDPMDKPLGTQDGKEVDLLLETSRTIGQMAEIIRTTRINEEKKVSYGQIMFCCMRFQLCITPQTLSRFDGNPIGDALCYLDSLISENEIQELAHHSTLESRFQELNRQWSGMQAETRDAKVEFVRRWLKFGAPARHLNQAGRGLQECVDLLLQDQQMWNSYKHTHYGSTSPGNYEPSYAVYKAAHALFDALQKCRNCSCSTQHDIGAKLELGTYLQPIKMSEKTRIVPYDGDDATGGLDFDMFLSMGHDWHEVRIKTDKKSVVGLAMDGHAPSSHEDLNSKRVEHLCSSINEAKSREWQRLILKLTWGQLFNERIEKSNFWIDKFTPPISLLRCFEEYHDFFTEKIKRILCLMIGYAVFHLEGTRWLQLGWGSANIKFFQTIAHKTPLRPFIQVDLPEASDTTDREIEGKDNHAAALFEPDSRHCCPALISLAVVLIEVCFAKPFSQLAQRIGIPLDGHITLSDVDQVLDGENENKVEGLRSQIPEDSPLLKAIDNCLDPEMWEDKEHNPLHNEALKSQIYKAVVRPLEHHLSSGFRDILPHKVDDYARNLDFGQWGRAIDDSKSQSFTSTQFQGFLTPHRSPLLAVTPPESFQPGAPSGMMEFQKHPLLYSQPNPLASSPLSLMNFSSLTDCETAYQASQFFDDEASDQGLSTAKTTKNYIQWRTEYEKVYEKCIRAHLPDPPSRPVKIGILDTGIDQGHDVFKAREERIKAALNFYNTSKKSIPDLNGHGTFTASLILDYAQDAELYIAKIADKENATPNAKIVVEAINHAVNNWDVDIISLSFGWPSTDFQGYDELEDAIDRAYGKKILIFAAASNNGGRLGRAYPASNPQVICVHSTDTLGNSSDFSPTAEPDNLNFATVGESIESAWPMLLCNDLASPHRYFKSRSGTSYATPIMAGIAAFLLQYARLHLPEKAALSLKRKEKMEALLKRCARRGPNYTPRDNYYYVELSLHHHNLFGRELDRINDEILETLKR